MGNVYVYKRIVLFEIKSRKKRQYVEKTQYSISWAKLKKSHVLVCWNKTKHSIRKDHIEIKIFYKENSTVC